MIAHRQFQPNTPDVVYEVIEGEAVIVNLSNGMYYSVDRAGADIWELLQGGASLSDVVTAMTARYSGVTEEIESGVQRFVDQLQAEQLILAADKDTPATAGSNAPAELLNEYKPRFEAPLLQRYSDMEDLLLLDPVHNVDEEGVPSTQNSRA